MIRCAPELCERAGATERIRLVRVINKHVAGRKNNWLVHDCVLGIQIVTLSFSFLDHPNADLLVDYAIELCIPAGAKGHYLSPRVGPGFIGFQSKKWSQTLG